MPSYEPNIEGAIEILVDIMLAESVTMAREPYAPNFRGLVDALIDLKEGFPTRVTGRLEVSLTTGENITQGDALYLDTGTGKVMKAVGNVTEDEATVIGFAKETKFANNPCDVQIAGILAVSGLNPGVLMFLSDTTAGAITATGQSVIKFSAKVINGYYKKEVGKDYFINANGNKAEFSFYTDTDSTFVSSLPLIEKRYPGFDETNEQFVETIKVDNVYNRLLLFSGNTYHGMRTIGTEERLTLPFFCVNTGDFQAPNTRY